ncbi:hypothetical protein EV356DRAFT_565308 [Viridothelium virens]|uniref:Hypervirulence associated protein TUDOR domain-containing protein n=1 Tax=Viridothelium virens TaxID=1048519 RepID=A0A6A6HH29_VIRVR|nr:hypothetical protein EV356DRAFT_565308 [Viridothelium virens]
MADKDIKEGDEVSWQWSGGRPGGTAAEVATEGKVAVESHRGNTIAKNAEPDNPAVHVERPGNDVVKKASELEVDEEGPKHKGDAKKGEKREAQENPDGEDDAKKQKTDAVNGENAKKGKASGRGRPKKGGSESNGAASKPKAEKMERPKKEPKKAATADGQPRRSARNKS